jgi:hypothetical protein
MSLETLTGNEQHFVAYHSVQVRGCYCWEPGMQKSWETLNFLSSKIGLLKQSIGNIVWVIQGDRVNRKTNYTLCGAYIAQSVILLESDDGYRPVYRVDGPLLTNFNFPIPLNEKDWFPLFLKSQANFSLGFNRISEPTIIDALSVFLSPNMAVDSSRSDGEVWDGMEGMPQLVSHLRRERSKTLVEKKKAQVLKMRGNLSCEACGFDFEKTYGSVGNEFCEVHHIIPLSESDEPMQTTLNDLAILCSNCHRMIHRTNPVISVNELAQIIQNQKSCSSC